MTFNELEEVVAPSTPYLSTLSSSSGTEATTITMGLSALTLSKMHLFLNINDLVYLVMNCILICSTTNLQCRQHWD